MGEFSTGHRPRRVAKVQAERRVAITTLNPPRRAGIYARGFAFWLDSILLSLSLVLLHLALRQLGLDLPWFSGINQEFPLLLLGAYRIITEYFFGRSFGKAVTSVRVRYLDHDGGERRGVNRLFFVILRNSWLLVAGVFAFWAPDTDPGGLIILMLLNLLFRPDRRTLMDLLARAWVMDTKL